MRGSGYSRQEFLGELDQLFPKNQNYVVFDKVKSLCAEDREFSKVLRISLKRFFRLEIFCVNIKSVRTTRKIRNLQIKQGKNFVSQIFP